MAEKRTPAEQIAALDARLGVGVGAVKERAKLAAMAGGHKVARQKKGK